MESNIKIKVWMRETKTPKNHRQGGKEKGQYQRSHKGQRQEYMVCHYVPKKTHGEGQDPG